MARNVTLPDPRTRFGLYRLCECPECGGSGKASGFMDAIDGTKAPRCRECRGEGRIRQEVVSAPSKEAVGVALVTCAREGEWEGCAFGLLDRTPECEECGGAGKGPSQGHIPREERGPYPDAPWFRCPVCKGSGVKPTGTWLVLPWLPSPRNVSDAGRVLARSKTRT